LSHGVAVKIAAGWNGGKRDKRTREVAVAAN